MSLFFNAYIFFRKLANEYPSFPSVENFLYCTQQNDDISQLFHSGDLYVIATFVVQQKKLQCGGYLLPDLIEFYNWLHSSFSLSVDKAVTYKIGNVIKKLQHTENECFSKHLVDLYERIKQGCKNYLKMYYEEHCMNSREDKMVINDETTLIYLLSSKLFT